MNTAGYGSGMTDDVTHYDAIEAYCDRLSYLPGETASLHVWCGTEQYEIEVRRWGGDVVWHAEDLTVWLTRHPTTPTPTAAVGPSG